MLPGNWLGVMHNHVTSGTRSPGVRATPVLWCAVCSQGIEHHVLHTRSWAIWHPCLVKNPWLSRPQGSIIVFWLSCCWWSSRSLQVIRLWQREHSSKRITHSCTSGHNPTHEHSRIQIQQLTCAWAFDDEIETNSSCFRCFFILLGSTSACLACCCGQISTHPELIQFSKETERSSKQLYRDWWVPN